LADFQPVLDIMHRDFKIGLAVGVAAAAAATVWLSTLPNLGTESRALRAASAPPAKSPEIFKPPEQIQTPVVEQKTATARLDSPGVSPAGRAEQNVRIHIVQKGDTLSAISEKYYGTARYWQKIFAANDAVLKDPDRLIPGTRLIIPE
jgi:nucleoid-associated protein YgaU